MEWSGRAPAPPVIEAGKGCQRQGARHVSEAKRRDSDSRHRYRQELIPKVRLWNAILHRRRIGKFIRQGIIKDEVSLLLQGNRPKINATADDGIAWLK
jgi:hypothetical protein